MVLTHFDIEHINVEVGTFLVVSGKIYIKNIANIWNNLSVIFP